MAPGPRSPRASFSRPSTWPAAAAWRRARRPRAASARPPGTGAARRRACFWSCSLSCFFSVLETRRQPSQPAVSSTAVLAALPKPTPMRCVRREAEATEIATLFVKSDSKNREALESRPTSRPRRSEAYAGRLDTFLGRFVVHSSTSRASSNRGRAASPRFVATYGRKRSSAARVTQSTGRSCTRPNDAVAGALPPPA